MPELLEATRESTETRTRLRYFAWRRYRIPADVADDLLQSAATTFLEVRHRYPKESEHAAILTGIFRNLCRAHIEQTTRERRRFDKYCRTLEEGRRAPARTMVTKDEEPVVAEIVRREQVEEILAAVAELRPEAREMFELIVNANATRSELIRRYGLNPNTFDSRLRTYRLELRKILERRGVCA